MNSDSIPVDLITEILSRLPQKSITRFRCVSKLWASILRGPYFSELFLTRSSAQPRILLAIEEKGVWSFFSSHQRPMSPYEKSSSSLVVAAEFHVKFPPKNMKMIYSSSDRRSVCDYASGLVYFYGMWIKEEDNYGVPVICNPNTGKYLTLPYLTLPPLLGYRESSSFFGFDPIDKQFKVLFMDSPHSSDHKILTLGTGEMKWRTIKCPLPHDPLRGGICINGVLYYLGDYQQYDNDKPFECVIVCFDVRSEKFKFIYAERFCTLINYKGKLCVVDDLYGKIDVDTVELHVWVLEDAEKEEWSKYAYSLRDHKFFVDKYDSFVSIGVTSMGEIIFSTDCYTSKKPFYVFYYNPEKNTLQSIEIQGFGEYHNARVVIFADHVEDLKVNDTIKHLTR